MLLLKYNLHLSPLFISFVLFWCNFCSMLKYILYAKVNVNFFAYWVILLLLLNCFYIWPHHENMASFAAALGCIQLPVTFKKEGKHTSTRTIQVRFLVLPCDTNYNCILGRTILKLIEALVPCKTF
jgi:hypothetical protein